MAPFMAQILFKRAPGCGPGPINCGMAVIAPPMGAGAGAAVRGITNEIATDIACCTLEP